MSRQSSRETLAAADLCAANKESTDTAEAAKAEAEVSTMNGVNGTDMTANAGDDSTFTTSYVLADVDALNLIAFDVLGAVRSEEERGGGHSDDGRLLSIYGTDGSEEEGRDCPKVRVSQSVGRLGAESNNFTVGPVE